VSSDAFPFDRFWSAQLDIQSALDSIQVRSWNRHSRSIPEQIWVLGLAGYCQPYFNTDPENPYYRKDDPNKDILSVVYTRQSLVLSLWEDDCGIASQPLLGRYPHGLGSDAWEACLNEAHRNSSARAHCDDHFKSKLRRALRSLQGPGVTKKNTIDAVLLSGERAGDERMTTLLCEVLGEIYSNGASVDLSLTRTLSPDPTFVGSRAAARAERGEKEFKRAKDAGFPPDL
jgi:hypothetical protein